MMPLYHYTSLYQLKLIMDAKQIDLCPSNLVRPDDWYMVEDANGIPTVADETDDFKPVVWLTNFLDFKRALKSGLNKPKTECAIVVKNPDPACFVKWDKWAIANGIEKKWFNALKRTAPEWPSFYVTEKPIVITNEGTGVIFRPDIRKALDIDDLDDE